MPRPLSFFPVLLLASLVPISTMAFPMAPKPPMAAFSLLKVRGFAYYPEETTIVLPMRGPRLKWKIYLEPSGRVAFIELPKFNGAARLVRRTQSLNPSKGLVQRILLANNRPNVVRIAVRGRKAIRFYPEVENLKGDRWLLKIHVIPYHQKAPHSQKPKAVLQRALPPVRPQVIARRKATVAPVPTEPPTSKETWLPAASATFTPEPTVAPSPIPTASEASMAIPLTPWLVFTPTPEPSSTPTPEPEPLSRVDVMRRGIDYSEDYSAGGSHNVNVPGITGWEIAWPHRWNDALSTRAEIGLWDPFTIVDVDLVGSSHLRRETSGNVEAYWNTLVLGQPLSLGGGLFARYVTNSSTVEPLVPSYLFSKQHFYTGLLLDARSQIRLWGPFSFVLGAQARPLTLPFFDSDIDSAGPLLGASGEAGLELAWKMLALRGTYRLETLRSPDFNSFVQNTSGWNLGLVYRY